ncbi:MAG: ArsR/SmtB family transcription factor [Nitrososphaerales archaeon]
MPSEDVDLLLDILGNETRRKILKLIAEEPRYVLQLAKELEVSQQAVLKHLDLLQQHGFISMFLAESEFAAPQRKYYELARSLCLRVSIAKKMIRFSIDKVPHKKRTSKIDAVKDLKAKVRAFEKQSKPEKVLRVSEEILKEIDAKFEEFEKIEASLMLLKQRTLRKAKRMIRNVTNNPVERKILYSILDGKTLSEFNMDEKDLRMALEALKQKGLIDSSRISILTRNE